MALKDLIVLLWMLFNIASPKKKRIAPIALSAFLDAAEGFATRGEMMRWRKPIATRTFLFSDKIDNAADGD